MANRKLRVSRQQAMAQKWLPLYELADRVKELAPWQWLEESDIFGVQDPDSGEIGFVSIMGLLGEHLCIGVYLGVNALYQFWALSDMADSMDQMELASRLLTIPQMQASFENREMVEKEDAGIMRRLKLNYRGHTAYPIFRSMHPGCPPVLLDMEKIPFLIHILEQTLDVAPRFEEDESLLHPDDVGENEMYLLRVPSEQDGELVWTDKIVPIPEPEVQGISFDLDAATYEALKHVPRVGNSVEIDLFMLLAPVNDKQEIRPFFPFPLLIVDADSGMVLSHDMLTPLPSIEAMYGEVPQKVIDLFLSNNLLPYEIYTQTPAVTAVLSGIFAELDVAVVERPFLPMLNEAKTAMMGFMRGDF
jgi:hypothetical protein